MKLISGIIRLKKDWYVRLPYPMTEMELAHYRFDPITIALIAATTMGAVGEIQAGKAGAAEAETQEAMMRYNVRLQEREAREIEARTAFEQKRQAEAGARVTSAMRAEMGAAGVIPSAETSLLVQAKQASELELENLMIGYRGQVGAQRARSQAELDKLQAKIYKRRGKTAERAGYMRAGTTLLRGFGTTF